MADNFFSKKGGKEKFIGRRALDFGTRRTYLLNIVDHQLKVFTYVRPAESFKILPNFLKTFFKKLLLKLEKEISILVIRESIISPYVFMELVMPHLMFFNFKSIDGKKRLEINFQTGALKIVKENISVRV